MNIAIDGRSLQHTGGIERVVCNLGSAMAQRGHAVFIFISDAPNATPVYPIHEAVRLIHHRYTGDIRQLENFRRQLLACAPDVCLSPASGPQHLLWCAALWDTGIPWVYSEHGNPDFVQSHLWNAEERRAVMSGADAIHLLLHGFLPSIPLFLRDRVRVIPNPLLIPPSAREQSAKSEEHVLLALGRLVENKQNHLLVQAFAMLAPHFPRWRLDIWGEGEERPRLERMIRAQGMKERIRLCGTTASPQEQYAGADIFCTPSRVEGFGLTAVEAMSCGLPVVGFAGCSGINELVQHKKTGLLASEMTMQSLAEALRTVMADEELRRNMAKHATQAAQAFAPLPVYDAWEKLLIETAGRRGHTCLRRLQIDGPRHAEERICYACLQSCVHREHIFLPDADRLRLFIWRHPILRQAIRPIRRLQHRLQRLRRRATDGDAV